MTAPESLPLDKTTSTYALAAKILLAFEDARAGDPAFEAAAAAAEEPQR